MEYDVKLRKAGKARALAVEGTVHRPDGTPLAGAEVAITYPNTGRPDRFPVAIGDGKLNQLIEPKRKSTTDASGQFRLDREPDPEGRDFSVVVVHPDFFAEADRRAFEASPTIQARPWGRIEGMARVGSKPAAGVSIICLSDRLANPADPYLIGQLHGEGRRAGPVRPRTGRPWRCACPDRTRRQGPRGNLDQRCPPGGEARRDGPGGARRQGAAGPHEDCDAPRI